MEDQVRRGLEAHQAGDLIGAEAHYRAALRARPDAGVLHDAHARLLLLLGRDAEAIAGFDRAIALGHDGGDVFYQRGVSELALRRDAGASFAQALARAPDFAKGRAANDLGVALLGADQVIAAIAYFERAVAAEPEAADFLVNLGHALLQAHRVEEAAAAYDRAVALDPDAPNVAGGRLLARQHLCDWRDFTRDCADLVARVRRDEAVAPLTLLPIASGPDVQLAAARLYTAKNFPARAPLCTGSYPRGDKIRIGYLSSDLHQHPVGVLLTEMFEAHDRARFEIFAFSTGPEDGSDVRRRLRGAFDHFIDAAGMSDGEIAGHIHVAKIDILFDLNGHTEGLRTGILSLRPASLQVSFMGYAATMGAPYMDYLIADDVALPPGLGEFFDEQIVRLPPSFQVNSARRVGPAPLREAVGLPAEGFVFCSFNNSFKLTPDLFDVWMRLLRAVPGSVLWQKAANEQTRANLVREAAARGVAAERLVFAPQVATQAEHLARLGLGDLFLDTLYYNAHSTAADALWCGVPVLTCPGETFASRIAASLVTAAGLPEMAARSLAEYEALALALAREPGRLAGVKARLAVGRAGLFDVGRHAGDLEGAYQAMWERRQRGLAPISFATA